MIRRNHIETVTKIDRKTLQSQGRSSYQNRYAYKKEPEVVIDENYRAIGSNNKYQRYKGWREQTQNKAPIEKEQPMRTERNTLHEFNANEAHLRSKVEKQYEAELDAVFKRQYLASKVQPDQLNIRAQKKPSTYQYLRGNRASFDQNMQRPLKRDSEHSHQVDFENSVARSPPRHRSSYQSTKKYTGLNYQYHPNQASSTPNPPQRRSYTPLFESIDQQNCSFRDNSQSLSYAKRQTGKIVDYKQSLKTLHDEKKEKLNSISLRSSRKDNFMSSFGNSFKDSSLPVGDGSSIDEKVGDKLKMISDFNDQINERIKNIIVCFEELRTRI